jgi:hypothetical protein
VHGERARALPPHSGPASPGGAFRWDLPQEGSWHPPKSIRRCSDFAARRSGPLGIGVICADDPVKIFGCPSTQYFTVGVVKAMSLGDMLVFFGGSLELAGVLAVVADLVSATKSLRGFVRTPQIVPVGMAMDRLPREESAPEEVAPSLDERLAVLERRVAEIRPWVKDRLFLLEKELRHEITRSVQTIRKSARDQDLAVEGLVRDLSRGRWYRRSGVASIAAGIVLTTWGSIIG